MLRRALLLAPMLLLLWVGAASAQMPVDDNYTPTVPTSLVPTSLVSTSLVPPLPPEEAGPEVQAQGSDAREAGLARTGADSIGPLLRAAIVLLGGGTLLVLVARRRRAKRAAS